MAFTSLTSFSSSFRNKALTTISNPVSNIITSVVAGNNDLNIYFNTVDGATSYTMTAVSNADNTTTTATGTTSPIDIIGLISGIRYTINATYLLNSSNISAGSTTYSTTIPPTIPSANYTNYATSWTTAAGASAHTVRSVATSYDGKYVIYVTNGSPGIMRSTNYGVSFVNVYSAAVVFNYVSMSYTGNYVLAVATSTTAYKSSNYGASFSTFVGNGSYGCCVSGTGQYQIFGTGSTGATKLSTDYGATWTSTGSPGHLTSYMPACSYSGQYMITSSTSSSTLENYVKNSSNYGVSWNVVNLPGVTMGTNDQFFGALVSIYGDIQLIGCGSTTSSTSNSGLWYSSDYGITWNKILSPSIDVRAVIYDMKISLDGQYMLTFIAGTAAKSGVYYSTNTGNSWTLITSYSVFTNNTNGYTGTGLSKNAQYAYVGLGGGLGLHRMVPLL